MDGWDQLILLLLLGLGAGGLIGYTARINQFCTLSVLERHWYANGSSGLRTWILTAAVALIASQTADALGWADLSQSFYLSPTSR
ncbi:hypothetical protein [Breoghania sp.]|uniref:hypothetical protein n=1 Tax=Breoghania sp. TaxID=2065378 RepID=UPI00261D2DE3|nr:hypothetical protein [Breoghania sp.]MDJ0930486.1 hypothetical protein [Breoghania sp.]